MSDSKCLWVSTCPYYETTTSYGVEQIRCANTDCALHGVYLKEESEADDK